MYNASASTFVFRTLRRVFLRPARGAPRQTLKKT